MSSAPKSKSALVLAGGGMTGAAYEIGALTALDRLFAPDFSTGRFDVFVGTSAGSILATLLANRIVPSDIYYDIAQNKPSLFNWRREDIYRIDRREIWSNLRAVIANVFRVLKTYKLKRWDLSLTEILHIFQEQLPAGLYSLDPLQSYLCNALREAGMHDDFDRIDADCISSPTIWTRWKESFSAPRHTATCIYAGPSPLRAPTRFSFGPFK